MRRNLYQNLYIEQLNVEDVLTDSNYPTSTSYIDVTNFTHFAFVVLAGTVDTELTLQVYQDTSATETASIKAITDATETIGTGDSDETFSVEVAVENLDIRNSFRYVTLTVSGVSGANDYAAIFFVGWNARHQPVTQPDSFPAANSTRVAG